MNNFFRKILIKVTGIGWCGTPTIQMNKSVADEVYNEVMIDIPYLDKISPAYIQRRYKVNYEIAKRVIDLLEENNIIGPANGAKPRDIIKKNNVSLV